MNLSQIGRYGELRLRFEQRQGRTRLVENYSKPPLQVMQPIEDPAGCLCVYLLSPTGGVVQGDHYALDLQLGANTHALFTTPSATKIYKMPTGCATQTIQIEVESDAFLEFIPDANILFGDSDFRQEFAVCLHENALCLLQDVVMPGRLARNESLQFRRYSNRLEVRDPQGLVLYDNSILEPTRQNLQRLGILEQYPCWGTLYLVGNLGHWGIDALQLCQTLHDYLLQTKQVGALAPLYRQGIAFKVLGFTLDDIYSAFRHFREALRRQYLGLADAPLRK